MYRDNLGELVKNPLGKNQGLDRDRYRRGQSFDFFGGAKGSILERAAGFEFLSLSNKVKIIDLDIGFEGIL